MEVGLRPILKRMEPPPNPKAETKAHRTATFDGTRQKSAKAIVAHNARGNVRDMVKGRTLKQGRSLNELA
jgi:hypothetical protein